MHNVSMLWAHIWLMFPIKSIIDIYAQEYVQIDRKKIENEMFLLPVSAKWHFPSKYIHKPFQLALHTGQHRIRVDNFN